MKHDFEIHKGIESFLPKQTQEEADQLDILILQSGHIDDLVLLEWDGKRYLGDGHHRKKIADARGIKYSTRIVEVADYEGALRWVFDNQLARRNLTPEQFSYLRGQAYHLEKKIEGRPKQETSEGAGKLRQNDVVSGQTSEKLGKKYHVSERTIERDAEFAQAVDKIGEKDPEKKEQILNGTSGQTKAQVIQQAADPSLCPRCNRVGKTKNCEECKRLKEERKKPPEPSDADESVITDEEGHVVPEGCREAFVNLPKFKALDSLCQQLQKGIDEMVRIPGGEQLGRWTNAHKVGDTISHRIEALNELKRHLNGTRPYSVCPWCKAKNPKECSKCNGAGWISKMTWRDVDEKVKARLS